MPQLLKWRSDKEYMAMVSDLLETDEVKSLAKFTHHYITDRLSHCISVSYRSFKKAKKLGLDARAAARGGLLHDLYFYTSEESEHIGGRGHLYEHPRIALANAEKITLLTDTERDIIVNHMCGVTLDVPKTPEGWIVTAMDKEASIREFSRFVRARAQGIVRQPII